MARRAVNEKTLFHLVPANLAAQEALVHPDNYRFVTKAAVSSQTGSLDFKDGLEIGYHVPQTPGGHVITRLGRNTDLILRKAGAKVHIAFEINPETRLILLSTRSRHPDTVKVKILSTKKKEPKEPEQETVQETVIGDCVLVYGQEYNLTISCYSFDLVWRAKSGNLDVGFLKNLAWDGYGESKLRLETVRSRDYSEEQAQPSGARSWYHTRLVSARWPRIREIESLRTAIGRGNFGKVFQSYDLTTGHTFAVKVVNLREQGGDLDHARASLHREVKILERLSHENIIELLTTEKWNSDVPEIFMPLCRGNVMKLAQEQSTNDARRQLCEPVLEQMLRALDYLDYNNLCHRDVKPENILFSDARSDTGQQYLFQLADFGFANYYNLATTFCGTMYYMAPEFWPTYGVFEQTSKVDVWSLYASLLYIHPAVVFPPPYARGYIEIVEAVRAAVPQLPPVLRPMARVDPTRRASAAQILAAVYGGHGLTTPFGAIPPILPDDAVEPSAPTPALLPVPRPSRAPAAPKIVTYNHRRLEPRRRGGYPKPSALPLSAGLRPGGVMKLYAKGAISSANRQPVEKRATGHGPTADGLAHFIRKNELESK